MDMTTNRKLWQKHWKSGCYSGSFTTAGGLVFTGQPDGTYLAFNAMTGEQLWSQKLEAGVNAPGVMMNPQMPFGLANLNGLMELRAQIVAYSNDFLFMTYVSLPAFLIIWLMRKPNFSAQQPAQAEAME